MNPYTDLPQFWLGNLGEPQLRSYLGFGIPNWVGRLLQGKIAKIVIYDHARVNGVSYYEYPGQPWVPKL